MHAPLVIRLMESSARSGTPAWDVGERRRLLGRLDVRLPVLSSDIFYAPLRKSLRRCAARLAALRQREQPRSAQKSRSAKPGATLRTLKALCSPQACCVRVRTCGFASNSKRGVAREANVLTGAADTASLVPKRNG